MVSNHQPVVINPGGGPVEIDDVDAYIAQWRADGVEPMVDCGGGMVLPLAELVEDAT